MSLHACAFDPACQALTSPATPPRYRHRLELKPAPENHHGQFGAPSGARVRSYLAEQFRAFAMMQYRPGDASSSSTSVPLPLSPISDSSQTRALYADDVLQGESDPSRVQYLQLPPQLRSAPQERVQRLQRFYDLHLGESINARRLFNYELLDMSGPSRVGTAAALDTL